MQHIASSRQSAQLYVEKLARFHQIENHLIGKTLVNRKNEVLEKLVLNNSTAIEFQTCVNEDSVSFYEKGILSLLQGIDDVFNGLRTWPTVKFYYSIFYTLKAELFLSGYPVLRTNRIYTLAPKKDEKPKHYNNKAKGDHGIVIELAKKYLRDSDDLQSQSIDDQSAYEWIQQHRDWAHYKSKLVTELNDQDIYVFASKDDLNDLVPLFWNDPYPIYCFDLEYAILALPIVRLRLTREHLVSRGLKCSQQFQDICYRLITDNKMPPILHELYKL